MFDDTIAAISTPLGEGGLAVVRLSGRDVLAVADRSFRALGKLSSPPSAAPSHTIHYGRIVRDSRVVDEVLLSVLRAPRTFTREDMVEISCHGGLLPAKLVLDTVLANGARLAEPGEFTKRAFLNGRIDLAQAEAVADLIHSRTELALAAANEQLAGKLSQRINALRDDLMRVLAHIEAHIDFPDEDISPDTKEVLLQHLEAALSFMDDLLRTANEGQVLRRGVRAAIIGRPNVGKSSLLNQLLGHDRAIVSPIPGTTRDTIEETSNIRGLPIVFIDTAGLRESGDVIELEGIRRSRQTLERAELILHVLDVSEPLTREDELYLTQFADKKRILVRNKSDLPDRLKLPSLLGGITDYQPVPSGDSPDGMARASNAVATPVPAASLIPTEASPTGATESPALLVQKANFALFPSPVVDVSCVTGQGLEALKDTIRNLVWGGEIRAEMLQVMINSRHQDALQRARIATQRTLEALRADLTLELVALDLRIAVNAVGEVVGKTTTEDLLDSIFSQFCLGK